MSELFGVAEVQAFFAEMAAQAEEVSREIVKRGEAVVESAAKRSFTGSHRRTEPTTAPPGHPPDVVTGMLRRSIVSSPVEMNGFTAKGTVYPTAIYARIQELGGIAGRGAHLPARPYLQPSLEESMPELRRIATEEWSSLTRL